MTEICVVARRKEEILNVWARRSAAGACAPASGDWDHLPQLIAALSRTLRTGALDQLRRISREHSRERFAAGDFTLKDLLAEYTLMKDVVLDVVEAEDPRFFGNHRMIDRFFSEAMSTAAEEFATLREAQIKKVTRTLEATNRDLERFAAVAAHDLRSPAATISSFAEVALEDRAGASPEHDDPLVIIRDTSLRMISLIDQLLIYAKIGQAVLERQSFAIAEVVNEARQDLEQALQVADAHVEVDVEGAEHISGDRILFGQLFQNLFANSLKFRHEARPLEILVRARRNANGLRLLVRDNGHGFDAETARTIFEPFFRGHADPAIEGSGLGLATVHRVVDVHGGRITARGLPGRGAEFEIELP